MPNFVISNDVTSPTIPPFVPQNRRVSIDVKPDLLKSKSESGITSKMSVVYDYLLKKWEFVDLRDVFVDIINVYVD